MSNVVEASSAVSSAGPRNVSPMAQTSAAGSSGRPPAITPATTPAGFQSLRTLAVRRTVMATLCLATLAAIGAAAAELLGAGGWSLLDIGIFATVLISAPWTVLGFWNAVIGLWLLRVSKDPLHRVAPFVDSGFFETDAAPATLAPASRVAVLMTLRNEDPERAFQRLIAVRNSLDALPDGDRFDVFVLSDTNLDAISAAEEQLFAANRDALNGRGAARYRRRTDNAGYKAGNVRDFLDRWGDEYEFFVPLDADSVMSGGLIRRMVGVMAQHPKLGILQSLAVGAPATSPFARLFQFGMRHGMRSFTMGSAWWQGDCGPFWGHNAIVRTTPFKAHCHLPVLPGKPPLGGHILSHDQLEAALLRRAGYEVRVIPVEGESWEDNPVTLLDFMKRETRWCNGNMQYWPLLGMRGLRPVSRFQLFQAIMMYLGPPAWMLMTLFATLKVFESDVAVINPTLAIGLFFTMFAMSLAPKVAGVIDAALEPGGLRRYGGGRRFLTSTVAEIAFGMLMAPAMALRLTIFMIGLAFGRRIVWSGQVRDAYGLKWSTAWRGLWPQSLFGLALFGILASVAPVVLPWAAPVLLGLIFATPFAVATASPAFGELLTRYGLATIPEEVTPEPMLERVDATSLAPGRATASRPESLAAE